MYKQTLNVLKERKTILQQDSQKLDTWKPKVLRYVNINRVKQTGKRYLHKI